MDRVLSSLGLPGWFRHAYFAYHSQCSACGLSLACWPWSVLDSVMVVFTQVLSFKHDVYRRLVFALV